MDVFFETRCRQCGLCCVVFTTIARTAVLIAARSHDTYHYDYYCVCVAVHKHHHHHHHHMCISSAPITNMDIGALQLVLLRMLYFSSDFFLYSYLTLTKVHT